MNSEQDMESWLLDFGDELIHKKSKNGIGALSALERAVYNLWVIDYAVRNSGSFGPIHELQPSAIAELVEYGRSNRLSRLSSWLSAASDEAGFCSSYYENFEGACAELYKLSGRT